jgi:uncharacterized membrane protein YqjE
MDDIPNFLSKSLVILFLAFVLVMIALTIRVIAKDARRRGKNPVLVVLLCLLSFPLGWIIWLIIRPEPLPRNRQPFRLEDRRVQ